MFGSSLIHRLAPVLFLGVVGCADKIGDPCVTDIDCSQQGDRLCDTTQEGGYCTQDGCDPTSCPEKESVCVAFNNRVSTQGACNVKGQTSPYRRNFCMAVCDSSGDCRSGYACIDMAEENDWGAAVIDERGGDEGTKVCIEAMSFEPHGEEQLDEVCTGVDGNTDSSAGGAGGSSN